MKRTAFLPGLIVLAFLALGCPEQHGLADPSVITSTNFEHLALDTLPAGWQVTTKGYSTKLIVNKAPQGKQHMSLTFEADLGPKFGNFMIHLPAKELQSKNVELSAKVRAATPGARAQMWLRVDRPNKQMGSFDNMHDRPITSDQWQSVTIKLPVDADAVAIAFGVMSMNRGTIEFDDIVLREVK